METLNDADIVFIGFSMYAMLCISTLCIGCQCYKRAIAEYKVENRRPLLNS